MNKKKPFYKTVWFWLFIVFLAITIFFIWMTYVVGNELIYAERKFNTNINAYNSLEKSYSNLQNSYSSLENFHSKNSVEQSTSVTQPSTQPSSTFESSENSSSSIPQEKSSSSITPSSSVTKDQEDTLIVFTQQECEDKGYKVKYGGRDLWNVAAQDIDGGKRWIVTKKDKEYKRVKCVFKRDGEPDSGATPIYLLINGNELINNL